MGFRGGTVLAPSTPGGRGEPRWGHGAPRWVLGWPCPWDKLGVEWGLPNHPKTRGFAFGVCWLGEQEK